MSCYHGAKILPQNARANVCARAGSYTENTSLTRYLSLATLAAATALLLAFPPRTQHALLELSAPIFQTGHKKFALFTIACLAAIILLLTITFIFIIFQFQCYSSNLESRGCNRRRLKRQI